MAFLVAAVGVKQSKKHIQIFGKIKRACANRMLQPGFSAYCKSQLVYASNDFEELLNREIQLSVGEHWVIEQRLLKFSQFSL